MKYLKSIIISFLVCCLIYTGLVALQVGAPTASSKVRYITNLIKSDLVDRYSKDANKFTIISGSNALEGISCDIIRDRLKINCVNAATTVSLDVEYILYQARKWVKPGDVVLLPLEYEFFAYNGIPNQGIVDYTFARDFNYFKWTDWATKLRLLGGVTYARLAKGLQARNKPESTLDLQSQAKLLNQYGDFIANKEAQMSPELIAQRDNFQPLNSLATGNYIKKSKGLAVIKSFVEDCQKKNVTVLATWANMVRFEAYQQPNSQAYLQSIKDFYQGLNVPILGTPETAMYDISLFFDSPYHLHDRGVKIRTEEFVKTLTPYIAKTKNINIASAEI